MLGQCKLCQAQGDLQLSHIVPSFVFKWLKKDGYIRHAENIDRRIQDGEKDYLLCVLCEQRLNAWETQFANNVFHPINANEKHVARYDDWLLKFCVSISWRTLTHVIYKTRLSHLSTSQIEQSEKALATWRQVMLDELRHPGKYEQHLIPLSTIESTGSFNFPPNINRYLIRNVELDVGAGTKSAFVYSKLGRFAIFGFIDVLSPKEWSGTKVHVRHGTIGPRTYTLPYSVGTYLSDRATKAWELMKTMSENQQRKVDSTVEADPERFLNSEVFQAMQQDIKMFGSKAFTRKK